MEMLMKMLMARLSKGGGKTPIPQAQPPVLPSGEPGTNAGATQQTPISSTPTGVAGLKGLTPEQQAQMERLRRQQLMGMDRAQQAYEDFNNPNMSTGQAALNAFDRRGRFTSLFNMFQ